MRSTTRGQYEDVQTYYQRALQLREKGNVSEEIVESVQSLAETQANLGQYEQAIRQYLRALDVSRAAKDTRGAAIEFFSLGSVCEIQGSYGAA